MLATHLWLSDSEGCLPGPGLLGRKEEVNSWKWLTYQCLESPRTLETEIWEWIAETSLPPHQGHTTLLSGMRLTSGCDCCVLFPASSSPDQLQGWEMHRKSDRPLGYFWIWVKVDTENGAIHPLLLTSGRQEVSLWEFTATHHFSTVTHPLGY